VRRAQMLKRGETFKIPHMLPSSTFRLRALTITTGVQCKIPRT
jgi:hypothetical protein